MNISIIICTKDRSELLRACLASIFSSSLLPEELIVLDQSGNSLTEQVVHSFLRAGFKITYYRSNTRGKSRGINSISPLTTGEIIGFTDDDCLVETNWIAEAKENFLNHPEISLLTGKVIPTAGEGGEVYTPRFLKDDWSMAQGRVNPWEYGCVGANMFVKREIFSLLKGFDERLGPGAEFRSAMDGDFVYRATKAGFKSLYSPQLTVYHQDWRSDEENWQLVYNYALGLGAFAAKHFKTGDFLPLGWIGLKFFHKCRRLLLGLLLMQKTRLLDGAWHISGLTRGFTKRLFS